MRGQPAGGLTADEQRLVLRYRQLSARHKAGVRNLVDTLSRHGGARQGFPDPVGQMPSHH